MTVSGSPAPVEVALLARRVVAAILDTLCLTIVFTVAAYALSAATDDYEHRWTGVFFYVGIPLVLLAYFVVCEGATSRTPGKALCGLRVARRSGEPCGWAAAIVRNAFRVVDGFPYILPYFVGALILGVSSDRRRLGDRVAETSVIRNRAAPAKAATEVVGG
ncbi:MAG: RDD family protein [Chloroflexi bacterium]|nr:RDD family protein [Chloroflexota bacterium]